MRKNVMLFIFVLFSIFIVPGVLSKSIDNSRDSSLRISSQKITNFNITEAIVEYRIKDEGDYTCTFSLLIIGKEGDNLKNLTAAFNFTGYDLTNFDFSFQNKPIHFVENRSSFYTVIGLTLNQSIIPGQTYTLTGNFHGFSISDINDILTYNIGVDWGTHFIGKQEINIITKKQIHSPNFDNFTSESSYQIHYTKYQWIKGPFERSYYFSFEIIKINKSLLSILLIEPVNISAVNIGKQFSIFLTNNGSVDLNLWITYDSDFDLVNDTNYPIFLQSKRTIILLFSVSYDVENRSNGSIYILADPYIERINLLFSFIKTHNSNNFVGLFIIFIISTAIIAVLVYGYFNQIKIRKLVDNVRSSDFLSIFDPVEKPNTIKKPSGVNSELEWLKIESRWSSILHENEMKVIEIIFYEADVNQKDIAEGLGFSDMKISRLVTKLEKKELLFRQASDKGNIIKLNYERLLD